MRLIVYQAIISIILLLEGTFVASLLALHNLLFFVALETLPSLIVLGLEPYHTETLVLAQSPKLSR